jgi:hypothetical protein
MFLDDIANLSELIRFGFTLDGLNIHRFGDLRMLKPPVTTFCAIVNEPQGFQQSHQVIKGEIVEALARQQFRLKLVRFVHSTECIQFYAIGQVKSSWHPNYLGGPLPTTRKITTAEAD